MQNYKEFLLKICFRITFTKQLRSNKFLKCLLPIGSESFIFPSPVYENLEIRIYRIIIVPVLHGVKLDLSPQRKTLIEDEDFHFLQSVESLSTLRRIMKHNERTLLAACFMLVSCLAFFSSLKMEATENLPTHLFLNHLRLFLLIALLYSG
jgi:hypothetical protein